MECYFSNDVEYVVQGVRQNSWILHISKHRERFSRSGLSIHEYGTVKPI